MHYANKTHFFNSLDKIQIFLYELNLKIKKKKKEHSRFIFSLIFDAFQTFEDIYKT